LAPSSKAFAGVVAAAAAAASLALDAAAGLELQASEACVFRSRTPILVTAILNPILTRDFW
jgi:hypothetical protein